MIHITSYNRLSYSTQVDVLLQAGVYLDLSRVTSEFSIELYALGSFYVEIYFNRETEDPLFLRVFSSVNDLEPYLSTIDIEGLLQVNK